MNLVSNLALAAALALGAASVAAPAQAQDNKKQEQPKRQFKLSKEERAAVAPFQTAVAAKDWAAASAALPAAIAAAQSPDAKYVVAFLQIQLGLGLNDEKIQAQGIDALIASNAVPADELVPVYRNQAVLASKFGDKAKAEASLVRATELAPNDVETLVNLAQLRAELKRPREALVPLQRAIQLKSAAAQPVEESWYKYALKLAFEGRLPSETAQIGRELLKAYPTQQNWRDALLTYRDLSGTSDRALQLDLLRLMRQAKALESERDWYELAEILDSTGYPGEAKAVLDEGVAQGKINPSKAAFSDLMKVSSARLADDRASLGSSEARALAAPSGSLALKLADAYLGYRDYAKAVGLYRAALQKGGVDANVVNTRLGMALAMAGQKDEAEAAFKAVTGARAEVANYWLLWLASRA